MASPIAPAKRRGRPARSSLTPVDHIASFFTRSPVPRWTDTTLDGIVKRIAGPGANGIPSAAAWVEAGPRAGQIYVGPPTSSDEEDADKSSDDDDSLKNDSAKSDSSVRDPPPIRPLKGMPKARRGRPRRIVVPDSPMSSDNSVASDDSTTPSASESPPPPQKKLYVSKGLNHGIKRRGRRIKTDIDHDAFPFPILSGLRALQTQTDFRLPYDIYCPTPGIQKVPNWRNLKRNVWIDVTPPPSKDNQRLQCNCTESCGEVCLNRLLQYECDPMSCPFGAKDCGNRAIQVLAKLVASGSRYARGYEVVKTGNRGYGLRATRAYAPGELIIEYTGDVISQVEMQRRLHEEYQGIENYYALSLEKGWIIDSGLRGSAARFVNHSCDPNCEMQKWYVQDVPRIGLYAGADHIAAGTELTYDYNFDWFKGTVAQTCNCASVNCRGVIGKKSSASVSRSSDDSGSNSPTESTGSKKRKPGRPRGRGGRPVGRPRSTPKAVVDELSSGEEADSESEQSTGIRRRHPAAPPAKRGRPPRKEIAARTPKGAPAVHRVSKATGRPRGRPPKHKKADVVPPAERSQHGRLPRILIKLKPPRKAAERSPSSDWIEIPSASATSSPDPTPDGLPVKRKVGRPRKHPRPEDIVAAPPAITKAPILKKRLGWGKKHRHGTVVKAPTSTSAVTRKKRERRVFPSNPGRVTRSVQDGVLVALSIDERVPRSLMRTDKVADGSLIKVVQSKSTSIDEQQLNPSKRSRTTRQVKHAKLPIEQRVIERSLPVKRRGRPPLSPEEKAARALRRQEEKEASLRPVINLNDPTSLLPIANRPRPPRSARRPRREELESNPTPRVQRVVRKVRTPRTVAVAESEEAGGSRGDIGSRPQRGTDKPSRDSADSGPKATEGPASTTPERRRLGKRARQVASESPAVVSVSESGTPAVDSSESGLSMLARAIEASNTQSGIQRQSAVARSARLLRDDSSVATSDSELDSDYSAFLHSRRRKQQPQPSTLVQHRRQTVVSSDESDKTQGQNQSSPRSHGQVLPNSTIGRQDATPQPHSGRTPSASYLLEAANSLLSQPTPPATANRTVAPPVQPHQRPPQRGDYVPTSPYAHTPYPPTPPGLPVSYIVSGSGQPVPSPAQMGVPGGPVGFQPGPLLVYPGHGVGAAPGMDPRDSPAHGGVGQHQTVPHTPDHHRQQGVREYGWELPRNYIHQLPIVLELPPHMTPGSQPVQNSGQPQSAGPSPAARPKESPVGNVGTIRRGSSQSTPVPPDGTYSGGPGWGTAPGAPPRYMMGVQYLNDPGMTMYPPFDRWLVSTQAPDGGEAGKRKAQHVAGQRKRRRANQRDPVDVGPAAPQNLHYGVPPPGSLVYPGPMPFAGGVPVIAQMGPPPMPQQPHQAMPVPMTGSAPAVAPPSLASAIPPALSTPQGSTPTSHFAAAPRSTPASTPGQAFPPRGFTAINQSSAPGSPKSTPSISGSVRTPSTNGSEVTPSRQDERAPHPNNNSPLPLSYNEQNHSWNSSKPMLPARNSFYSISGGPRVLPAPVTSTRRNSWRDSVASDTSQRSLSISSSTAPAPHDNGAHISPPPEGGVSPRNTSPLLHNRALQGVKLPSLSAVTGMSDPRSTDGAGNGPWMFPGSTTVPQTYPEMPRQTNPVLPARE